MDKPTNESVIVNRGFGSEFPAQTVREVYLDVRNQKGEIVGVGPYIGTEVRTESGHLLFAQHSQMRPANG